MMTTNKLKISFGILIISLILFFRFFRQRTSGPIDITYTNSKFFLYFFLSLFFFSLILFWIIFLFSFLQKDEKKKNILVIKIKKFLYTKYTLIRNKYNTYIDAVYEPIYILIHLKFPNFWFWFSENAIKVAPYWSQIISILYFFPPCLVSFIFFYETIICKNYIYFPYIIYFMIFPLLIRLFVYILIYYVKQVDKILFFYIKLYGKINEDMLQYAWADNAPILPEQKTNENLFHYVHLKHTNLYKLDIFTQYQKNLQFSVYRFPYLLFSLLCSFSSFVFLFYLMYQNKPF